MPEWKQEIRKRLTGLNLPPIREEEIIQELADHLENRYEETPVNTGTITIRCLLTAFVYGLNSAIIWA